MKNIIERSLPLNVDKKYVPLLSSDGCVCDNYGKLIAKDKNGDYYFSILI